MDVANFKNVLCKVSLIDEHGGIILDTLVNPEVPIDHSNARIHGIRRRWLSDAPTATQVRDHLQQQFMNSVFVGHSVQHDLTVLGLFDVHCIDTYTYEDINSENPLFW